MTHISIGRHLFICLWQVDDKSDFVLLLQKYLFGLLHHCICPTVNEQGRYHGQFISCRWRVGGGSNASVRGRAGIVEWLSRGSNAQKSPFQLISRHPKFYVADIPANLPTEGHTYSRLAATIKSKMISLQHGPCPLVPDYYHAPVYLNKIF